MTSSATPVPSRNALRALRNLAFSHPAIFAGAVGSACCTAAVSCEIQRRVRLAEKLVATKRTLRSISDGKGKARVAQMCEAAERGENFLLDQRSAQRRRRRRVRHHSTAAAWQEDGEEQDHPVVQTQWKEPDAGPPRAVIDGPNVVNNNNATGRPSRSTKGTQIPAWARGAPQAYTSKLDTASHIPHRGAIPDPPSTGVSESYLKGAATHAWTIDSQRQYNSVSAEKVRAASMKVLKPRDYHIYGRKSRPTEPEVVRAGEDTALDGNTVKNAVAEPKPHQPVDEEDTTVFEASGPVLPDSLSAQDPESVNGVQADMMPVRDSWGELNGYAPSSPTLSPKQSTDLVDVQPAMPDTGVDGSHLPPTITEAPFQWQSPLSDFLDFAGRAEPKPADDPDRSYSALSDELDAGSVLDFDYQKSKYFRRVYSEATVSHIDLQRLYAKPSGQGKIKRLDGVSRQYFLHNIASLFKAGQFEQAERVYHSEYNPQRHGLFPPVARILVQHLLSDSSTHHRAIRILFPKYHQATGGKGIMEQNPWVRTHFYMQEICALSADSKVWEAQAAAILDAARAAGLRGHAKVLESITRSLCAQGHARRAEDLINSATKKHNLKKFLPLDRLLVISYARNHDWTAVNRIMQSLQEDGVPRERPNWYSSLFKEVFTLHLQDHSLELAYDYLVNAMGYWKLAPTRAISCTLIAACIRSGDYLHLQQWIEAIRSMWPRVDIGTGSRRLAIEIAMIWTKNQATCEQMERACSAMAFGSIDDPFSPYFRSITQELAAADLRRHIEDCGAHEGSSLLPDGSQAKTLPELVAFAEQYLIRDTTVQDSEPCREHALESLSRQLRAIERLNQVMAGRLPEHMGILEDSTREPPTMSIFPAEPDEALKATPQHVPAALRSSVLPHTQILWPIIAQEYARQYHQGRSSSHDLLEYVVAELQSQGRDVDAAQLLDSVAASPFVTGENGKYFSTQLYGEWLSIASRMDSVKQSHKAMWAILDASRYLKVTSLLLLRAAHCAEFTHVGRWGDDPDPKRPDAELRYLYHRIRKLRWVQLGMNKAPKLAEWTPWGKQEHIVPLVSSLEPHQHSALD